MVRENGREEIDISKYRVMSDAELEEILRLDFYEEESEESLRRTLCAMKVLAERKRENGTIHKTPEEAFDSFKTYYMPEIPSDVVLPADNEASGQDNVVVSKKTNTILRLRRTLAGLAAVIAIVFFTSISARAMGFDLWDYIIKWTKETFSYHTGTAKDVPPPDVVGRYTADSEEKFLELHDMTTGFTPRWLPEGFILNEMTTEETFDQLEVLFKYGRGQEEIQLSIKNTIPDSMYSIEKSSEDYDIYEADGIVLYLYENYDINHGFWSTEEYECCLSGQLTQDEIIAIFDSMEKG